MAADEASPARGLLVDKPAGITSHDVVARVRRERGGKVGHAGTLDPFATGLLVLPGGIDVHTHLDAPNGDLLAADDFRSGGIAAACGGTTTHIDFCAQLPGQTLAAALDAWHAKADGKAAIDYGFHIIVVEMNDGVRAELDHDFAWHYGLRTPVIAAVNGHALVWALRSRSSATCASRPQRRG